MQAMAQEAESSKGNEVAPKVPVVPLVPLVVSVVAAVVVATGALGGTGWWLVKSGRLPIVQGATRLEVVKEKPVKLKLEPLEPLLVNLADSGGKSYLRVAMTLRVEEAPPAKGEKPKGPEKTRPVDENEAALRDAALEVLGRQTGAQLLAADGKQRLKAELQQTLVRRVPEARVKDVLFTEFLVQQ